MEIMFLGHSCFRIKGKKSSVVVDPYSKEIGFLLPKVKADAVVISHDHFDHNDVSRVEDYRVKITEPGEYEVGGIKIVGIASFHDEVKGAKRGENTIYKIVVDDIVVVHLGDLGTKLTDEQIEDLNRVEVLLLPVGGKYTIGADEAVEIVKELNPAIVVPMHFKEQGKKVDVGTVGQFIEKIGLEARKVGKKLTVKKEDLGEETELVLMGR